MVYLVEYKQNSNLLYCFENKEADIEETYDPVENKLVWVIPHTGTYLNPETLINYEEDPACYYGRILNIRKEVNGYKNQKEAEFNYEDNEPNEEYNRVWIDNEYNIAFKPSQIYYKGNVRVYKVESPFGIKMIDENDGKHQTLKIGGLKKCMAVFITDDTNLLGFHYVTGNVRDLDCKDETMKIEQMINLLRINNMDNTNSKLIFYKKMLINRKDVVQQKNEMELLALKFDFDKYEVYTGSVGDIMYDELSLSSRRVTVGE